MSCTNCNNSSTPITLTLQYDTSSCSEDSTCTPVSAACIYYGGPNLSCSGIETEDSVELALQKIDELLCQAAGDYSTYNFHCLDDEAAITTESQFVSAITDYLCTLNTSLEAFTGTTFVNYQGEVDDRFVAIEGPSLTCATASVTSTDSISTILTKYCSKFGAIDTALSLSSVTWDSCFTVTTAPTTIAAGFNLLADQICQVKASITSSTLPTFDNTGSCLSSPGATDTLVSTVEKIKTRLCLTPTLNNDNLSSSCISIPATDTDLEALLQSMLDKLDTLSQNLYTFDSGDFSVAATDSGDACAGKTVALSTPINQDRFVAANASDSSPSTLINKIVGVGITVDDTTNAGKITLTATSVDNYKVKANTADSTPDYLDQKLSGQSNDGIILSTSYNATTKQVDIFPSVSPSDLLDTLFSYLEANPSSTLKDRFCALNATCPYGVGDCLEYTVTNASGEAVYVTWTDCTSGLNTGMYLYDSSSANICCQPDSISAPGCSISLVGACPGGVQTTSTTSTSSTTTTTTTVGT